MYKEPFEGVTNFNAMEIQNKDGAPTPLDDLSITSGKVTAYFRDLEANFIRYVHEADAVFGCMAWLTNGGLLRSFVDVPHGVSIIVQKEDFLRPDYGQQEGPAADWRFYLHHQYDRIKPISWRGFIPGVFGRLSTSSGTPIDAVRCVGHHNRFRKAATLRMHNKFMVFCRFKPRDEDYGEDYFEPYAVWTGSFNFSENAARSFENAVVIEDAVIAEAYLEEYSQIAAFSEPLNWASEWCAPQYCLGT